MGPFLWNIVYDDLLRIALPRDTYLIGYADDTMVISHGINTELLETRLNEALYRVKKWMDKKQLQIAVEKTEAVLITDRRSFAFPNIVLDNVGIAWRRQITYLGVEIDHRLSFGPHISKMADKAAKAGSNLARLMPNLGGPKEVKRRVISSVVHSKMLYAAPVWADSLEKQYIRRKYVQVQRRMALRIASAYRTVSDSAALVITSIPPIELLAKERKNVFNAIKELKSQGCPPTPEQIKEIKEGNHSILMKEWQEKWENDPKGRWTYQLIPELDKWINRKHGAVNYYLTQALTGHGCFKKYLYKCKIADNPDCSDCPDEIDDAMHTIFSCAIWDKERQIACRHLRTILTAENMVSLMTESEGNWRVIEDLITNIMRKKESLNRT